MARSLETKARSSDLVELETVLGADPESGYRAEHEAVLAIVGIDRAEAIAGSYVDLIAEKPRAANPRSHRSREA